MKLQSNKSLTGLLFVTATLTSIAFFVNGVHAAETVNTSTSPTDTIIPDTTAVDAMVHGEETHKNHCYKCHSDDVYTREDRFVKSLDALSKQVVRCKDNTGAPWFDEDSDAVVQFLNDKYYRF